MLAGSRMARIIVASMRIATSSPTPICLENAKPPRHILNRPSDCHVLCALGHDNGR